MWKWVKGIFKVLKPKERLPSSRVESDDKGLTERFSANKDRADV